MKRSRAGSRSPIDSRKAGCSDGSSSAISASTSALSASPSAPRARTSASSSGGRGVAASASATLRTTSIGRRERKPKCAISRCSASVQRRVRSGCPASSCPSRLVSSCHSLPVFPPCSLRNRSSRRSTTPRSESTSSASTALCSVVMALNSVVLPVSGNPTSPAFMAHPRSRGAPLHDPGLLLGQLDHQAQPLAGLHPRDHHALARAQRGRGNVLASDFLHVSVQVLDLRVSFGGGEQRDDRAAATDQGLERAGVHLVARRDARQQAREERRDEQAAGGGEGQRDR